MKCCRKVYLDWGTGWQDVTHITRDRTLEICIRAASNTYHKAQNYVNFTLTYDEDVFTIIYNATEKIKVRVTDASSGAEERVLFTGMIPPTASREYNGKLDNIMLSLEGVDSQSLLEKEVGDWYLKECFIMDPSNKAKSLVHQLAYIAGFTDEQIDQTITIPYYLSAFAPNNEKDKVLDILDILLFEYGYVFNMNHLDKISPIKWIDDPEELFVFDESKIIKSISVKQKERQYNAVDVRWYEIGTMENTRIYTENLPKESNGQFAGYPIPTGFTYPIETNVIDRITLEPTIVYQEFTNVGTEYATNEAILNNLDYNYKAFSSDFSDIIITENHVLKDSKQGLSLITEEYGNKKAQIKYKNNMASSQNLFYMHIDATVIYKSSERVLRAGITEDSELVDRYESYFIFTAEDADRLARNMVQMYSAGNIQYEIESEEDISEGIFVRLYTRDATDLTCFVMEKRYSEATGLFSYLLIGSSYNEGIIVTETVARRSDIYAAFANAMAAEANSRIDEISGDIYSTPENLDSVTAVATKDGLRLEAVAGGIPSLSNFPVKYLYQISTDYGSTWTDHVEGGNRVAWTFNRSFHGYPSISDLSSYRVRAKGISITGEYSPDWVDTTIDVSSYLGWTPLVMSAGIRASNRAITLGWQAQDPVCYGDLKYEIQVCKAIQEDDSSTPADREQESSWKAPSSVDIYGLSSTFEALLAANDPASVGYLYRYGDKLDAWGTVGSLAVTGSTFTHTLPLDQEVVMVTRDTGDYLSTVALDTLYYYRIRTVSYDGETLVGTGAWSSEISASAAASSALDVVRNMLNTATIVDGSIVAEKLFVDMLSAITANMGQITDGALVGNENNYWILTTGEYGGVTRYAGDFRVGNELGDYFKCVWNPVTEKYEIDLKASSFRITAEGTEFDGEMIVTNDADPTRRCRVTSAGPIWERFVGGVWVAMGEMSQDLLGNLTVTNDPGNAPRPLIEPPSAGSVYYHFDNNMLDQNGGNGADITATGTLVESGIIPGQCLSGSVSLEVGESAQIGDLGEITLSSTGRGRYCCWEKDGIIYLPIYSSTAMERYDIATETMLPEITLSSTGRGRYCCWEKDGIIYLPIYSSTAMERYDIATETMLPEITLSSTGRERSCCWEKDGIIYLPLDGSTVMERYDIATETMLPEITLSSTNRSRFCCWEKDGIIYLPIYSSTAMERYDIATETMLPEITLSSTNRSRFCCWEKDGIIYIPKTISTAMERYDIATETMLPEITLSSTNRSRFCCWEKDGIIYLPIYSSTAMERYDIATETMLPEITLSSTGRERSCCWEKDGIIYIPNDGSTIMERYDALYSFSLITTFSTFSAWFKGSITLPGGVQIYADSTSWHYVVLSVALNEITYTVYDMAGAVLLTDSYDYDGQRVSPSPDLLLTGRIDELLYDATTTIPPAVLETVFSKKLPWGYGLDASKEWLIIHAKDPAAVSSNAFLTKRNPAALGAFSVRDLDDEEDLFSVGESEIVSHKPHRMMSEHRYPATYNMGTAKRMVFDLTTAVTVPAWFHVGVLPFSTESTYDILALSAVGGNWTGVKARWSFSISARPGMLWSQTGALGGDTTQYKVHVYNNGSSYDVYLWIGGTFRTVLMEVMTNASPGVKTGTGEIRFSTPPGTLVGIYG